MKPTFHASVPARSRDAQRPLTHRTLKSPVTDWSFQASAPAIRGPGSGRDGHQSFTPAFRKLTETIFSAEARRESRFEGAVLGVVAALATWPIVLAVQATIALIK
jgi:hypothetical protein